MKRLLDIALSLVAIMLVVPLMLLIALVLWLTAGEVIYRAPRIGRDGQLFTMFKFVTMARDDSGPQGDGRRRPADHRRRPLAAGDEAQRAAPDSSM